MKSSFSMGTQKLLGVVLSLGFMRAWQCWHLRRVVLNFRVRLLFFFRREVVLGQLSSESTEALVARYGAQAVVPFAY